jgi:hypothetical protein
MRIRILRDDTGAVLAVEQIVAARQTVGGRQEQGTLVALRQQRVHETEMHLRPLESVAGRLMELGFPMV